MNTASIVRYQGADTPPPPVMRRSPPSKAVTGFVDKNDDPVTFTIAVPLAVMALGVDALVDFTNRKIRTARIAYPERRVVGHIESTDFSSEFCGEVLLQVTCTLRSTGTRG